MKQWHETRAVLDRLAAIKREGKRAALATVVRVIGSAYRHEGAKLLVEADGTTTGNVSGGCLEQDVREVALQALRTGNATLRTYCSGRDEVEAWDLGLGCEGRVDVFVEPVTDPRSAERALLDGREPFAICTVIEGKGDRGQGKRSIVTRDSAATNQIASTARRLLDGGQSGMHEIAGETVFIDVFQPPPQLLLCGAGDDAQPLARIASVVGFSVAVADRRTGLLTRERFPDAAALVEADGAGLPGVLSPDSSTYAVVMTHNFGDDRAYLAALLATPVAYIGMLGPRARTERMLGDLGAHGLADDGRVYGPVGLDIGTDGAEQVALAVIAEILAVRSGRRARSLRERPVPIHAPAD